MLALIDADDQHHRAMVEIYESAPDQWVLPWAILPEIDYMLLQHVGIAAERAFLNDLAEGSLAVEWGHDGDMQRANEICRKYRDLKLGLVDATVAAMAERLRAVAIATLDVRHFGALKLDGAPVLLPRDA